MGKSQTLFKSLLVLALAVFVARYENAPDWQNYETAFNKSENFSWFDYKYSDYEMELGFIWLCSLFKKNGFNFSDFLFFYNLFSLTIIFRAVSKSRYSNFYILYYLLTGYQALNLAQYRFGLAFSLINLVLFNLFFLRKIRWIDYLNLAIAGLVHYSTLPFVFLIAGYSLAKKSTRFFTSQTTSKALFFFGISLILLITIGFIFKFEDSIVNFVQNRSNLYRSMDLFSFSGYHFSLSLVFTILYVVKRVMTRDHPSILLIGLNFLVLMASPFEIIAARWNSILTYQRFEFLFGIFKKKSHRMILSIVFLGLALFKKGLFSNLCN